MCKPIRDAKVAFKRVHYDPKSPSDVAKYKLAFNLKYDYLPAVYTAANYNVDM